MIRCFLACLLPVAALRAQTADSTSRVPQLLGAQITVIGQWLLPFHSPYAGANSLVASGDAAVSHTYGIYLGDDLTARFEAYLDVEMARGSGISHATGLAGYTNGDVIRQGSSDLGQSPYIARAFVRYVIPLASKGTDHRSRGMDQLPGTVPARRIELTAGKLAASDLFDVNSYANNTRLQFMNWVLFNNGAWDFAADTRGYSNGIAVAWIAPRWALRAGSFQMPRRANGNDFDSDVLRARGDNVELTVLPDAAGTVARLLVYLNHGRMGSYAEALAIGRARGAPPDIAADDRPGRTKTGLGFNLEQPLADSGETGAFARVGWNDGKTEDFVFTEADRHLSAGVQVSGAHWHRSADHFGIAFASDRLSAPHRDYLAAGGLGFLLGDGRLDYAPEDVFESYYRAQFGRYTELSPDVQVIEHPGYNRDRGPATVLSLRVNLRY